jgi:NADH-quinone oxidoreductase subunit C
MAWKRRRPSAWLTAKTRPSPACASELPAVRTRDGQAWKDNTVTDGEHSTPAQGGDTPDPQPKATADKSAPIAQPENMVDSVAEPSDGNVAGGSVTEPTSAQEGEASGEAPLGNLEAMQRRFDVTVAGESSWGRGDWTDEDVEKHPVVQLLKAAYPDDLLDVIRFRDETTIHVTRERFRDIAFLLRDDPRIQLNLLADLTAVDMLRLRTGPRFDVVAQLYSIPNRTRLRMKTGCDDGEPVPSLVPVWNGANWMEREAYDMFGIIFEGHPNLRRMLLPDDWDEGHPLRKDYPLRGWNEFPVYNTERTVPRVRTRWTGRGV